MNLKLSFEGRILFTNLVLSGSKSESNRLLLLKAIYPEIEIDNLSDADDTLLMLKALNTQEKTIDIHHSGTAMRFLTAYFSILPNSEVILTGSKRMKERPIAVLVDALRNLGADIQYLEQEGFPPLKITGKELYKNKVTIDANISSQYISALMMIAPRLKQGLEITLNGSVTSKPYIEMTLVLLNKIGVQAKFVENQIIIPPKPEITQKINLMVESDWSSASYWYAIIALSPVGTCISLSSFNEYSLQADRRIVAIYKDLGVETEFNQNGTIIITKKEHTLPEKLQLDLNNTPDIAQTIVVTCFGLGIECELTGLHTLKIKETDRLSALKIEIEKLGGKLAITDDSLHLFRAVDKIKSNKIATYQDHRMAMAFAPLALKIDLEIESADVVSKSYPNFWKDLKTMGFMVRLV